MNNNSFRFPILKRAVFFTSMAAFCLSVPNQAAATVLDVENQRTERKEDGANHSVSVGLSGSEGSVDTRAYNLNATSRWQKNRNTIFFIGDYQYGKQADSKYLDTAMAHLHYMNRIRDNTWWEAYIQFENNDVIALDLHSTVALGLRYKLAETESFSSYVGVGLDYSEEDYAEGPGGEDFDDEATRLTSYLALTKQINSQVSVHNTIYYRPRINDSSDYRLLNKFVLSVIMSAKTNLAVGVDIDHDSDYPQQVAPRDTEYKFFTSFSISWP